MTVPAPSDPTDLGVGDLRVSVRADADYPGGVSVLWSVSGVTDDGGVTLDLVTTAHHAADVARSVLAALGLL